MDIFRIYEMTFSLSWHGLTNITYFSDFAFRYEKPLRSDNQSQKNKQP